MGIAFRIAAYSAWMTQDVVKVGRAVTASVYTSALMGETVRQDKSAPAAFVKITSEKRQAWQIRN